MAPGISDDHWDFLEQIEAPMWADLTLEDKVSDLDVDDDWFYRSHFFHQSSSVHLKSTIFHPVEGSKDGSAGFKNSPSPKLPSSVSRSRGKQYRCKKWGGNCTLNKQHPVSALTGKSSHAGLKTLRSSITSSHGSASTTTELVNKDGLASSGKANKLKPISTHGHSGSSLLDRVDEGSSGSTVTSERFQQQPNALGITTQTYSHAGGLLSLVRASIRKSFATREASRVEINKDRGQQRGHKSSSGKSSVGSSSNLCSGGSTSMDNIAREKKTPDSLNFLRMTQAAKGKVKDSNVSSKFYSQLEEGESSTNKGSLVTKKKSTHPKVGKLNVQNVKARPKAVLAVNVNGQPRSTAATKLKDKSGIGQIKGLTGAGKENVRGKLVVSQKCKSRGTAPGTMAKVAKGSERNVTKASDKGRSRDGNPGKNSTKGNQMVHFR